MDIYWRFLRSIIFKKTHFSLLCVQFYVILFVKICSHFFTSFSDFAALCSQLTFLQISEAENKKWTFIFVHF